MMIRKNLIIWVVATALLAVVAGRAAYGAEGVATAACAGKPITLYLFWGEGCPHCKQEKELLGELKARYPDLDIKAFETRSNKKYVELYMLMAKAYGVDPLGVPGTFLGERAWVGFNPSIAQSIEDEVARCAEIGCDDPIERLNEGAPKTHTQLHTPSLSSLKPVCIHAFLKTGCPQCARVKPFLDRIARGENAEVITYDVDDGDGRGLFERFRKLYGDKLSSFPTVFIGDRILIGETAVMKNLEREVKRCNRVGCACPLKQLEGMVPYPPRPDDITPGGNGTVELPIVGTIDASTVSLPLFTIIIGGLDGFNPCAFFVLFILLGMLVYARSRARMFVVGGTFVFFSGAIYFLFMSAWLNLFLLVGTMRYVTFIAAAVALVIGVLNTKDYFFFKKGVSLSIPEGAKPKLFDRMRRLMRADSLVSMLIGTVVLALVANTYELLCTAGFPMVFTRIITLSDLSTLERYLYLVLYNIVYVVPLMVIVLIFVVTLGGRKLKESEGRALKLLSGLMMLALGGVLLAKPDLLTNAMASIALLLIAVAAAALIMVLTRRLRR